MIIEPIFNRRSVMVFSSQQVEKDKLEEVFKAAQLAPSANNTQPWRFIYSTSDNKEEFNLMFSCLAEGNQRWVKDVPVLILSVAETISQYKNQPNKYAWHDIGLATSMLLIQAQALGLKTHVMGGFDADKAMELLEIPEPYQPVAMIALGYHGNPDDLSEDLKKRELSPRNRKPSNEVVFKNKFKNLL